MAKYSAILEDTDVPASIIDPSDGTESRHEGLDSIINISQDSDSICLHLKWDGLQDHCDWTWAPFTSMNE